MENEFGSKIKVKRLQLGLSLRKVCAVVNNDEGNPISVSYLNDIEQGRRKPPSGKIVVQLAEVLALGSQDLLNLAGKVNPAIEEAVNKDAEVGVLFRRIAEHIERDPKIVERIKKELDQEGDGQG